MTGKDVISYKFLFRFEGGEEKVLDIQLDPVTLDLLPKRRDKIPEWTLLSYSKCDSCPYNEASQNCCPIALNLADLVETFSDKASYEKVDVRVVAGEREYFKKTTLQEALSSAIGIYMVTSGCSVMNVLKPMVRHHLPFASLDETMFRTVSTYLMGQYFLKQKGGEPDWDLKKLIKAYEKIEVLNKAIVERFRNASAKDANYNALIILDVFAKLVPLTIERVLSKKDLRFSEWAVGD